MDERDGWRGPASSSSRPEKDPKPGRGTLLFAFLALVIAAAALGVAGLALTRSGRSSTSEGSPPSNLPTGLGATSVLGTDDATGSLDGGPSQPEGQGSPTPSAIDPGAAFTVAYQDKRLTIRSPTCDDSDSMTVDLDEPRIDPPDGFQDLDYKNCNPGSIETDLPFAQLASGASGPKDCLQQIQTNLGVPPIAPSKGLSVCFVTDRAEATSQGITQKIVILDVIGISSDGAHGILDVDITAWNVPN